MLNLPTPNNTNTHNQPEDFIKMIIIQKPISPKITELQALIARVQMRGNASAKKIKELRAKKLARQNNVDDKESMIAMVLAGESIPASNDVDSQLTNEYLQWEATEAAEQSLKPKLAAAKREASDKLLVSIKPAHDVVMKKLMSGLSVATEAWIELFALSSDLRDYEIGFRNNVCELMPIDLFGPPNRYSPLAEFMRAAVASGYLSALPKEFRA
jgi:hypothetical protein